MGTLVSRIIAVIMTAVTGVGGGVAVYEVQNEDGVKNLVQQSRPVPSQQLPPQSESVPQQPSANVAQDVAVTPAVVTTQTGSEYSSEYTGNYSINDATFGTQVTAVVANDIRTITSNALPNHSTGDFPNSGNPNTISAQSTVYTYPLTPTWTGSQTWAREPGVAINGVKFEPETAERVSCSSGEEYRVEAIQDLVNLGLDFNNAHVQPTGAYHYHGVSDALATAFDMGTDLVHVGFAADGYLIYYSQSGQYTPSYQLSDDPRTGTSCTLSMGGGGGSNSVAIAGSVPDGTYVSDWEYSATVGTLDACNGTTIDGTYAYLITDDYPYIGRCLNGSFEQTGPGGSPGGLAPGESTTQAGQVGSSQGRPQGGPGGTPPQEALDACASKSSGSSCSVVTPNGTLSGSCATPPGSSDLACMPN